MLDSNFPIIELNPKDSPEAWGVLHGEEQAKFIKELANIRLDLMLKKSPHLNKSWKNLAKIQNDQTFKFFPNQHQELIGISRGSGVSIEELIVLNNYTDFRDINPVKDQDEGCTSIGIKQDDILSGQTWDMHSTAKNYVCILRCKGRFISFSLVGCLGMMGANYEGLFIGVNNINTKDAKPGVVWPAFIRAALEKESFSQVLDLAKITPFTSGHNYLIADGLNFEHWEISPSRQALAGKIPKPENGVTYHTNHCLTPEMKEIEEQLSQSSTTHDRYDILKSKAKKIKSETDLISLLKDHENFPKSICGHYESGAQDPSMTCGGGVFNHKSKEFHLWRGCPVHDQNYKEYTLTI